MEKEKSSIALMLQVSIEQFVINYIQKAFEENLAVVVTEVLKKLQQAPINQTAYLFEKDLLIKYKVSKTYFYKVKGQHPVDRMRSGRFWMYNEESYLQACEKYRPKRPSFIKRFINQKSFRFLNISNNEVAFSVCFNFI